MKQLLEAIYMRIRYEYKDLPHRLMPRRIFTARHCSSPGSKGVGVAAAAAELGISREEVMAVGDNLNDLEMLCYAGVGVVMGECRTYVASDRGSLRDSWK